MRFIQPDIVHGPGLSVSQDDGLANKLGLSPVEFDKDGGCSCFGDWHGTPLDLISGQLRVTYKVTHQSVRLVANARQRNDGRNRRRAARGPYFPSCGHALVETAF